MSCRFLCEEQKQAATEAYWNDSPWPPEDLKALRRYEAFLEDFFDTDAEEINAVMEQMYEPERDKND